MARWAEQIDRKAALIEDQMRSAADLVARFGSQNTDPFAPYLTMLRDLYSTEYPLARVLDGADIVLHAEGSQVHKDKPSLNAFNWLCTTAERQFRNVALSVMDLANADIKRVSHLLDLRLTGIAPGSLYAGFSLEHPKSELFSNLDQEDLFSEIRQTIRSVARVPSFVEDERVSDGILEAMPDPAARDSAMEAAYALSPTGRKGIHTIDLSSPDSGHGSLSLRERDVLRAALRSPVHKGIAGKFTGYVRELDLDDHRIHLRGIEGIGSLRCALPDMNKEKAQQIIGKQITVIGTYETDRTGKPRLMQVDLIKVLESLKQTKLDIE